MTDRRLVRLVFVAVLACALPIPAAAQEGLVRFKLFNECRPIGLIVEDLPSEAATINLREEDIRTLAESRLRAARLFADRAVPYLYINVNVVGLAYSASVEFYKRLNDPVSGESWSAETWSSGSTGTSRSGNYILQSLSRHVDRFLLEYLRANEDACR